MEHAVADFRAIEAGSGLVRKIVICTCGRRLSQKVRRNASLPSSLITRMEKHAANAEEEK